MIADLTSAAKSLGARFTFGGLLPFMTLSIYVAALVVVSRTGREDPVLNTLTLAAAELGVVGWTALVVGSLVIAIAAEPFQIGFVRLLEGYWATVPGTRHLRGIATELQRRRKRALRHRARIEHFRGDRDRAAVLEKRLAAFPGDDELLLPTRLGNILRAGETRAGERYGFNTLIAWPRLLGVTSPDIRAAVAELHGQLDGGARLAAALAVAGFASVPVLVGRQWWILFTAGTLAGAAVSYYGAVNAASRLHAILETAFDLHRFDMRAALHLPLPDDHEREMAQNRHLSEFWQGTVSSPLTDVDKYDHLSLNSALPPPPLTHS